MIDNKCGIGSRRQERWRVPTMARAGRATGDHMPPCFCERVSFSSSLSAAFSVCRPSQDPSIMAFSQSLVPTTAFGALHASTSSNGFLARPQPPPPKAFPQLDLAALQSASRVLHDQFIKDAQSVPDLADMLTIRMFVCDVLPCPGRSCLPNSWRPVVRLL